MDYRKLFSLALVISTISLNTVFAAANFNYTQEQPQMPESNYN